MLVRLDCNTGSGTYTLDGDTLRVDAIASTRKACDEGSLDLEIGMALAAVTRYEVVVETSDRLLLHANDGTTLTFDPTLSGVVWRFTRFQGGDGAEVFPDDPRHYTLEFGDGGVANVVADCNRGRASVALDGNRIDLSIALTRAACPPGSISTDYVRYLEEAVSWVIRDGQLHLALPMDAGIASFSPVVKGIAPDATPVAGQR